MIVMKFDAGSMGSEDQLRGMARLVQGSLSRKPVVVTSALPKVTDLLLQGAPRPAPATASTRTGWRS
jgi:aspartokinase